MEDTVRAALGWIDDQRHALIQQQRSHRHDRNRVHRPQVWQKGHGDPGRPRAHAMDEAPESGRARRRRDRQHRHARPGVILAVYERERPEVNRRPEEQQDRQGDHAGVSPGVSRRAARQDRRAARRAADHDVQGRARLEPYRVDHDVNECAQAEEERQRGIERQDCQDRRGDHRRRDVRHPAWSRNGARYERPPAGAGHLRVGVTLQVLVPRRAAHRR